MSDENSLREAKRRATLTAIVDHATLLGIEHGVEAVTIEDICRAAGISRRTFFNYVSSKEEAILGPPMLPPNEEAISSFVDMAHADSLRALLDLFDHAVESSLTADLDIDRATIYRRRAEIFAKEPKVLHEATHRTFALKRAGQDAYTRFLKKHPYYRRCPEISEHAEAELAVALTASAWRIGLHRWIDQPNSPIEDIPHFSHAALSDLLRMKETQQ
ncbi:TetR/AcrR family transcriptional regulator [Corynebacterium tapiri]|uniref:TetR/AcrR family transcriptional regulator n=1 Tax=Corynebacterium tapiri TaxID=1448266 RepID=UPI001FE282A4|nr:TetR/AcrR family transcriptional regulator [Corynebacterium tapiri]